MAKISIIKAYTCWCVSYYLYSHLAIHAQALKARALAPHLPLRAPRNRSLPTAYQVSFSLQEVLV
jgi:hypothetical protein